GIETLSDLSRALGVNYYTLRYGLNKGNLRLDLAISLSNFFKVPISSLLISEEKQYIRCSEWNEKDIEYPIPDSTNIHYLMFCILNSEVL
ncbi:MAG: hypothetical protein K2I72_03595, partial [Bacilli bacterium]|nr:hypothetical protein [Bacilli bacterium]